MILGKAIIMWEIDFLILREPSIKMSLSIFSGRWSDIGSLMTMLDMHSTVFCTSSYFGNLRNQSAGSIADK